jgi:hypothetical protein
MNPACNIPPATGTDGRSSSAARNRTQLHRHRVKPDSSGSTQSGHPSDDKELTILSTSRQHLNSP